MQQAVTKHLFHVLLNEVQKYKAAEAPSLQRVKMTKLGAAARTEKQRCRLHAVCVAVMVI